MNEVRMYKWQAFCLESALKQHSWKVALTELVWQENATLPNPSGYLKPPEYLRWQLAIFSYQLF